MSRSNLCKECGSVVTNRFDYPRLNLCGRCSVAKDKKKSKDKRNLAYFRTMFKKVKKENKQLKEKIKAYDSGEK